MIYIFTAVLLIAVICLMIICIQILDKNRNLKLTIEDLNKDHNSISEENNKLRELLEIQEKTIGDAMKTSIERLN